MAHQGDCNVIEAVVQLLSDNGFGNLGEAMRIVLNEAMRAERSQVLEAQPYERSERRRGYANGYKPKTVATRLGEITLDVPQTRGVEFYPSALDKGVRSERALKVAICGDVCPRRLYAQGHRSDARDVRPGSVEHASQPGREVAGRRTRGMAQPAHRRDPFPAGGRAL